MLSVHYNYNLGHLQRNLQINSKANSSAMEKLASGFRINTAADDPAGLIISEQLRSQIDGLERAIQNTNESNNLMAITEGAMGQVTEILQRMKKLAIHSANTGVTSPEQIAANQAEMDSALQALNRIYDTTNVAGRKLLDNLRVKGVVPADESTLTPANVVATPETIDRESLYTALINGKDLLGNKTQNSLIGDDGTLTADHTLVLTGMGALGGEEVQLNLKQGESLDEVMARLRTLQEEQALYDDGTPVGDKVDPSEFHVAEEGVSYMSGAALKKMGEMSDEDAKSFLGNYIGTFNNLALGKGMIIDFEKLSDADKALYNLSNQLQNAGLGSLGSLDVLKGHDANGLAIYDTLSMDDLWSGGKASLANDPQKAMQILDQALKDATAQRASIGAAMAMAMHSGDAMSAAVENLTRMESGIRDTDMAESMVEYSRTQILTQVGTRLMSQVMKQNDLILDLFA